MIEPIVPLWRVQINDDYELVVFDNQSVEIRNNEIAFVLDEDASYKLLVSLQAVFPIVEYLNLG